jgi:hypothetical protein
MKQLQLQLADGTPITSYQFPPVPVAQLSAQVAVRLKNMGDEPLTGLKAYVDHAALRFVFGSTAITATTALTAQSLSDLAPDATLMGTLEWLQTDPAPSAVPNLHVSWG